MINEIIAEKQLIFCGNNKIVCQLPRVLQSPQDDTIFRFTERFVRLTYIKVRSSAFSCAGKKHRRVAASPPYLPKF